MDNEKESLNRTILGLKYGFLILVLLYGHTLNRTILGLK